MTESTSLDHSINKAAFWSAGVLIVAAVLSVFLPLDAPAGTFADRMMWYSNNVDAFVMGWVVQMIAMLTLTGIFAATVWQTRQSSPLSAFIAGTALLVSLVAFLIPKFIAIWSIPQMVTESTTVSANAKVAGELFQLLNPTLGYSLFTSFDYLGFWMYAVLGLLVALPLFRMSLSARISAIAFGLYGVLYHLVIFGVMTGRVAPADVGPYVESISILLLIPVISMAVYFRGQLKGASTRSPS